jgi:hypothetical protein
MPLSMPLHSMPLWTKGKAKLEKIKLLGNAGDIILNELIIKGFYVIDVHLVKNY